MKTAGRQWKNEKTEMERLATKAIDSMGFYATIWGKAKKGRQ